MQHLRAARLAKGSKREAKEEKGSEYRPKNLVARVDVSEEQEQQPEKESDLCSDSETQKMKRIAKSPIARRRSRYKPIHLLLKS